MLMSKITPKSKMTLYLKDAYILQLATSRDNTPWICSLHYVLDDKGNIYWITKSTTRHSEDIAVNPATAITIAVKTDRPLIGLQIEGDSEVVSDIKDRKVAMKKYIERHGTSQSFADLVIAGTDDHKLYKFTPKKFVLFDQVTFPDHPSNEWTADNT